MRTLPGLIVTVCFALAACQPATPLPSFDQHTTPTPTPVVVPIAGAAAAAQPGAALIELAALPVKGRAPKTGYSRAQFGPAWQDTDRNGCGQRDDVLKRDLTNVTFKAGSRCVVASGTLHDPYTGRDVPFVRGQGTSEAVQIDHVVALSDAWQTGAQQLTPEQRLALATDERLELLAVDGPTNQAKSDGDAATWLPPYVAYRCTYVALQVAVKKRYGLWVTPAEHDAIAAVLYRCPGQVLPS